MERVSHCERVIRGNRMSEKGEEEEGAESKGQEKNAR